MKTTHTLKAFAKLALILFVVLALINCSSPSNGTTTSTGTGSGSNSGLSKLSVTINRTDSTTTEFVFRAAHPAGTDSYSVSSGTAVKKDSPFTGVGVTGAAGLTGAHSNPVATFTVTAKDSSVPEDTSLATKVPGILKYLTATQDVDGLTDWFNFLDKTLDILMNASDPDYVAHYIIHQNIIKPTLASTITPASASAFFSTTSDVVAANSAMATILIKWNAIYAGLNPADKAIVDQTLPRIWFNDVPNPSNGATFNTVMLNWFKAQGYDVNIVS